MLVYTLYIILWLLFQLSVEINCQGPLKPKQRQWHTATFVDNKLYILDGVYLTNTTIDINEFIYLDVSSPFNAKDLPWQVLSLDTMIPNHDNAASVIGGANNNSIFLYGGYTVDTAMALVYTFDPISKTWSIPKIAGASPVRKQSLTGISNL